MIEQQVEILAGQLLQKDLAIAVAESCTGGWLAKVLTDLAGSSRWFDRGFVTYSNEAKQDMLGVMASTLDTHGAVSEAVVAEMALGAIAHSRANVSVAISGVAGPAGGSDDKPVGTVWFAWWLPDGKCITQQKLFAGDRRAVRQAAVAFALETLVERIG